MTPEMFDPSQLSGRNRRLLNEWKAMLSHFAMSSVVRLDVARTNDLGLPVEYVVTYDIKSISGVENEARLGEPGVETPPVFARGFRLRISIPEGYPCIDAMPAYNFLTHTPDGEEIPHPWHPNIRYYGAFAGRVCVNQTDTYTDIAWTVERIAEYLRYDLYHAAAEPPYPEDLRVAQWVLSQGEPNGWIHFNQN